MSVAARIDELARKPPLVVRPETRIGEILGRMKELRLWLAPVVDGRGRLVGVVSYRAVLMRGAGRDTRVATVMEPPFSVRSGTGFGEAVARFVAWRARAVPVVDERRRLLALASREDVLRFMLREGLVPDLRAEEVMSSPPVTVRGDESIARARWLMLRSGISRLPVVDDDERLAGVISLGDIAERLYRIRLTRRRGLEWIRSEEEFLAAPVREFMSSPPIHVPRGTDLGEVVRTLLEYRISGAPVTDGGRVLGVISGLDVMRKYVEGLVETRPLEAKVSDAVGGDRFLRAQVERLLGSYLSAFSRLADVVDLKVAVKEEAKAGSGGRYRVRLRLVTNVGAFAAEGAGWELLAALRDALATLEKRLKRKVKKLQVRSPPPEEGWPYG